jgi:hypothetical protein
MSANGMRSRCTNRSNGGRALRIASSTLTASFQSAPFSAFIAHHADATAARQMPPQPGANHDHARHIRQSAYDEAENLILQPIDTVI